MSDLLEFFGGIGILVLVLIFGAVGGTAAYSYVVTKPACDRFGNLTGNETDFTLGYGCIVKYQGEWVDYAVAAKKKHEFTVKNK